MPGKVERGVGVGFDSRAGDVRLTVRVSEPNAWSSFRGCGSSTRSRVGATFISVGGGIEIIEGTSGNVGSAGGNADGWSGDGGRAGIGGSEAGLAEAVSNLFGSWEPGNSALMGAADWVTGGASGAVGAGGLIVTGGCKAENTEAVGPSGPIVAGVDGAGNAGVVGSVGTTGSNVGGAGTGGVGTGGPGTDVMAGSGTAEVIGSEWDA